ncbi:MAG: BlaI/MecI/CopY family transcriptional regulator [Erysipelotrichaceae bacterium]|nr:BlaI/MecI/CopY family transcriptional regulator [Erysipelotrichaceae bacterium]
MIKLSDAEWKIVTCLWDKGSMTIAELTKFFSNDTGWCRNAIITLLNRMELK